MTSILQQRNIKLRHLQYFAEVARHNSVTAAARQLNTSQPAVSRALSELEQNLGTKLFDRRGTKIAINPAGRRLLAHALAALDHLEQGLMDADRDFKGQTVRAAVLPSVSRSLMPQVAWRFKQDFPDVTLHLDSSATPDFPDQLRAGELDLAIGRLSPPHRMDGLDFHHLYSEELHFVARHGHPLTAIPDPGPADLRDYPLILPPEGVVIREELDRFIVAKGSASIPNRIETLSFEFIRAILGQSDAISLCPRGAVRPELDEGTFVALPIGEASLVGSIGITVSALRKLSAPARSLIAFLKEEAASTP